MIQNTIKSLVGALVIALLGLEAAAVPQTAGRTPAIGEKAPDFSLTALDGANVTLADELEKGPVVLVLLRGWPGYQCPFCVRQFGEFLARKQDLMATGARVLWIYPTSDGNQAHAEAFVNNKDVPGNFRLMLDPNYGFTLKYGLRWDAPSETSYPSTFVIDRSGVVRFVEISRAHGGRTAVDSVLTALAAIQK